MAKAAAVEVDAHGQAVRVTSPDRVIYPDLGVSKIQLARYYEEISSWMLPTSNARW